MIIQRPFLRLRRFVSSKVDKVATIKVWSDGQDMEIYVFSDKSSGEFINLTTDFCNLDITTVYKEGEKKPSNYLGNFENWFKWAKSYAPTGLMGVLKASFPSKEFKVINVTDREEVKTL